MQRSTISSATAFGATILVLGMLSGCAAPAVHGSPGPTRPATDDVGHESPSPTPTGPAPLPANALFRISATVKAGNGATADLVETVYEPSPPDAVDTALLNAQCNYPGQPDFQGQPTWQSTVPDAVYLTTDITATLRPASPAFDNSADPVTFGFPGAPGAYSGSYGIFEAYCDSGYIQIPGAVHGVAPLSGADPVHGFYGWATASGSSYGFYGGGNDPGGPDLGGTSVVSNCVVQVSAAALSADPKLAAWTTTPYALQDGCSFAP
jgi:hypothetical protein